MNNISPPRSPRPTAKKDGPHPVDIHVGGNLREMRVTLGITQTKLGDLIGLTFQQIQKYESGANRISASRLYMIARSLDKPISAFFENLPPEIAAADLGDVAAGRIEPQTADDDQPDPRMLLSVIRYFTTLKKKDPMMASGFVALLKAAAGGPDAIREG